MNNQRPLHRSRSRNIGLITLVLFGLLAGMIIPSISMAQDIVPGQMKAIQNEKTGRTREERKLDSQLLFLSREIAGRRAVEGAPNMTSRVKREANGQVIVDISAAPSVALRQAISAAGGSVIYESPRWNAVRASVPPAALMGLATRADVKHIKQEAPVTVHTGPIDNAADQAQKADTARSTYSVNGSGVTIGVISDSDLHSENSIAAGELPASFTVLPGRSGRPGSGEGTAMSEIVYDIAPGAQIKFASAAGGKASFADAILELRAAGAKIIVDDISYSNEWQFQDDEIGQAVNQVVADGAIYLSSAGNEGNLKHGNSTTWEGNFVDGGTNALLPNGTVHNFGGQNYNTVVGSNSAATLQWSDEYHTSANDYDLFILSADGTSVVAVSNDTQDGNDEPFESVPVVHPGERIVIFRFGSSAARYLRLSTTSSPLQIGTTGQTIGHAATANSITVGAANAANAVATFPNVFTTASLGETYSSDGPHTMFYRFDGTPFTPGNVLAGGGVTLQTPAFTSGDCGATGVPGFATFCGTSAAAPASAAIAALVWSRQPSLTGAQVRTILESSTLDIEDPGFDLTTGNGILMADLALSHTVGSTPTPTNTPVPPTNTSTPTPFATSTSTPTPFATSTSTPTPFATSTSTPTPFATSTSTPTPFATSTSTPTPFATSTSTPTPFATSTSTPTPFATSTSTPTPFATSTSTPTPFATSTSTPTPFATSTSTPTPFATSTSTPTPFATSTSTPTPFATSTSTSTPFATSTSTPTPFATSTSTPTPFATSTSTPTPFATSTSTPTPFATSTSTPPPFATSTSTPTPFATATNTPLPVTPTNTPLPATATNTPTRTPVPPSPTWTPSPTRTPSPTWTPSPTRTPSPTKTPVPSSPTRTPSPTKTPVSPSPTRTPSPTKTPVSPSPTRTPSPTMTPVSPSPTRTPSPTMTPVSPSPTRTPSPTKTPVPPTATKTPTNTPTNTPIIPSGFPSSGILDTFNRADGAIGANWAGATGTSAYKIASQQLKVLNGDALYWKAGDPFGVDQEAFVTLSTVAASGTEQDLLLKVQDGTTPDWSKGVIEVVYNAKANNGAGAIHVETFRPGKADWTVYASTPVSFHNGDQFGARALANGEVWIYKNGVLATKVTLNPNDQTFFNGKGGRIGLWFLTASGAIVDDFGGGNITAP